MGKGEESHWRSLEIYLGIEDASQKT